MHCISNIQLAKKLYTKTNAVWQKNHTKAITKVTNMHTCSKTKQQTKPGIITQKGGKSGNLLRKMKYKYAYTCT